MSLSYTKSNSKLLKKNLSKSNVRSPKSVKTYIKEMNEEDKLKNAKNVASPQTEENPTHLKNVLNALKSSSKKKNFSQHNDDGQEEICDFKNIGNLSNISFSLDNSFVELLSDDEEQEATQIEPVIKEEKKRYIRLDEERGEDNDDIIEEEEEDLVNISNLNVEIIMSQIQSEKERLLHSKTQFLKSKEAYLENLHEIRYSACLQLQQLRLEEKNNQVQEQKRMEEIQKTDKEQVLLVEENYMKEVARKKDEILREVEVLNLEKEKKANFVESLLSVLHRDSNTFQNNLSSIQVEAQNIGCEGELSKILFQELPAICETTHNTLSTMSKFSTTEEEIKVISQRLSDGLKILEDIQRLLDGRKENISSQEEKAPTVKEEEPSESEPIVQPEQPPLVVPPPPHPSEVPQIQELTTPDIVDAPGIVSAQTLHEIDPSLNEVEELFRSLKKKFAEVSQEANATRENAQLRPLLSRGVGIINTLSNDKYDSSNKSKLQQILNLINGRPCTIGSDMISSANNPSAQAFVKEQLSTRLIALGHDKQVATMSAYASLIVRLWQWYPEVGELILFKLYETCPHLAPIIVSRESFQTDEEFCRALGIRIKEGGTQEAFDKYLTRMEASAQLYGRIVSMDIENHPHGIQEGWKWIARILIVPLQPTITTALLFGFLSTAGSPLLSHYGKQFRKLLHYICTAYLPLAEHHIVQGGRSALVSLKTLLEQYQRTNSLPQVPEGYKLLL